MTPPRPLPAAERQRRHRARRKQGRFVVPVEVTGGRTHGSTDQLCITVQKSLANREPSTHG